MYSNYSTENEKILIENIKNMKKSLTVFPNYINKITFPLYKNLEGNTSIDFKFPLTVFVGANGTNKSSVLRALQGGVRGITPGRYWFSTAMDPIEEGVEFAEVDNVQKYCFFYEFVDSLNGNDLKEVIKQRAPRENDPDYWETARPVLKYGMKRIEGGKRNKAVDKNVLYMDLRLELSAFSKCFYLGLHNYNGFASKRDYIRTQSKKLKNVVSEQKVTVLRNNSVQNELPITLNKEELDAISFVLGKKYTTGTLVRHKFFESWGYSVILNHTEFTYSDAVAGSGEIVAVRILHELFKVAENSLVLLDEPEISLHPGAQARLKYIILNLIKRKKLQVIISTHSTAFIGNLPDNAIKSFALDPSTNKVNVKNSCYFYEAFQSLGQNIYDSRATIHVEDQLAVKIISKVIEEIDPNLLNHWNIIFSPGGQSAIKNRTIPIYSTDLDSKNYVIFDGDQNTNYNYIDLDDLSLNELTVKNLDAIIFEITNSKIDFVVDGNSSGGREDQKIELRKKYYNYFKENVFFLPLNIPEDMIWNPEFIKHSIEEKDIEIIQKLENSKKKIYEASKLMFGDENNVNALEQFLLNKWIKSESLEKNTIKEILMKILEKSNCLISN